MSKLPLKVNVGIRDHWSKKDSDVQKSLASLQATLGIGALIEPDWPVLLADLDKLHPDKSTFVPSVTECVQAFCEALNELAEHESMAEWSDTLLEKAEGKIRASIETTTRDESMLTWHDERKAFVLVLPKSRVASYPELISTFKITLTDCFNEKPASSAVADRTVASMDDWADVSVDKTTGQPSTTTTATTVASASFEVDRLPDLATLARPDDLLRQPPYHLVVYGGRGVVEIHGSHSPTLELIAAYLKKWVRTNHAKSTKPPCVEVKLHQSSFGLGIMYDKITMEADHAMFTTSPMIVLPIIESKLGYRPVESESSGWAFRKDTPFKR